MTRLTPAQRAQIDYCKLLLDERATPQDMRDLGFGQAAIDAAINETSKEEERQ